MHYIYMECRSSSQQKHGTTMMIWCGMMMGDRWVIFVLVDYWIVWLIDGHFFGITRPTSVITSIAPRWTTIWGCAIGAKDAKLWQRTKRERRMSHGCWVSVIKSVSPLPQNFYFLFFFKHCTNIFKIYGFCCLFYYLNIYILPHAFS